MIRWDVKIVDLGIDPGEGWEPFAVAAFDRIAWRRQVEARPAAWSEPDPGLGVSRLADPPKLELVQ